LFLGTTAATFMPGCQPAKPGAGVTTDGDAKPAEDTKPEPPNPTDKPLDPVDAPSAKPTLGEPEAPQTELKKEEEKKAEAKNEDIKSEQVAAVAPSKPGQDDKA